MGLPVAVWDICEGKRGGGGGRKCMGRGHALIDFNLWPRDQSMLSFWKVITRIVPLRLYNYQGSHRREAYLLLCLFSSACLLMTRKYTLLVTNHSQCDRFTHHL